MVCFFALYGCSNQNYNNKNRPVKIIFDTDLGPDYDDVGALAFLHAMADSGKAEILATVSSNKHELVAPSIDVINTYFGRSELPVGCPKTAGVDLGSSQHWADSIVEKYPHSIKSSSESGMLILKKSLTGLFFISDFISFNPVWISAPISKPVKMISPGQFS